MKKWCSQMKAITHTTRMAICAMLSAMELSIITRTTGTVTARGPIRTTGTAAMELSIITRTTGTVTARGPIRTMVTTAVHAV